MGNPLLYGTTKQFLVHFGLNRLEDLPSIEEFDQFVGALEEASGSLPVEVEIADGVEAEDELEPASVPDEG